MNSRSPSVIVYEAHNWKQFLPLAYSRAVFQLICGAGTLLQQVCRITGSQRISIWCRSALQTVTAQETGMTVNQLAVEPTLFLNGHGRWHQLPTIDVESDSWVGVTSHGEIACIYANATLAQRLNPDVLLELTGHEPHLLDVPRRDVTDCVSLFRGPWDNILANERALVDDWKSDQRHLRQIHASIPVGVHLLNPDEIHVGQSTRIKPCVVIDAEDGPVWIGDQVTILPHSYVQGPAFIGDGCLLQPGAVVHAGSTIGPRCKVGGEIEASILQGFSNKQHDGFLGHSYIGSWVNIAADCINSDLKNTYGNVRVPVNGHDVDTGEMFVGMIVGDHCKAGINVSFPAGSTIGFASSVFTARSPKYVPSFAWVNDSSIERYDPQRALALAHRVMSRRGKTMSTAEQELFLHIRQQSFSCESQMPFDVVTEL